MARQRRAETATEGDAAPPSPSVSDVKYVKAITRRVTESLRVRSEPHLDLLDQAWLEREPQSLWPLLDAAIAAAAARKPDPNLIVVSRWLLANQLELVRYRLERGHDWAKAMLDAYQERLIGVLRAGTLTEPDWFELVNLLNVAKVPISPKMTTALAEAAADAGPGETADAKALSGQLRGLFEELGRQAQDPFMVVEGLQQSAALMPPDTRAFLTHEMAMTPQAVLREALPLLLIDQEPLVRKAAAAALEQIAVPETFSPVMLRRTLLVRNWAPEADREAIDRVIRKARLKGIDCAQWTAAPEIAVVASPVDGSGAQNLLVTTPKGRTGLFAGLLLKQEFGIRDTWCDAGMPRRDVTRYLRDARRQMPCHAVGRDYLDVVIQHHIANGLAAGHAPPAPVVAIAEAIGAADWKDRRIDVAAEAERLFAGLGPAFSGAGGIADSLARGGAWLAEDPTMHSWFTDDAAVRALVTRKPRLKPAELSRKLLADVLEAQRGMWAEKALLLALWLRAGDAKPDTLWRDSVVLARELVMGRSLADLPAMVTIAERSGYAARVGGW